MPEQKSAAAAPEPAPAKRTKRGLRAAIIAAAALAVLAAIAVALYAAFFRVPSIRQPVFTAGCMLTAGKPVITKEFCGTSYKCLSPFLSASDARSSCGDDLACDGACLDRQSVASPYGSAYMDVFSGGSERGKCSDTRSIFSHYERTPGCGL